MELFTKKIATYCWEVYLGEQQVGRVWMRSVNWVGPKWDCGIWDSIEGLDKNRLRDALYRLMQEIRGSTGKRPKSVIFHVQIDLDSDTKTIKRRVMTMQIACR